MKKFRKVLDGLTTSSPGGTIGSPSCGSAAGTPTAAPTPREIDVQETLTSDNFQLCKTVRHGFPYQPTALAFDPVQKILAIGSRSGGVRILGRPGVDCFCQHESGAAVLHLQFLINEGALVTACADDTLHLWNLRQRRPAVLHSLKFNRERITFCHLPFQSKWLYVGTERGNTHIVNIESFILSGYVIMWNKAIELSTKTHPGPVVHLSDSPKDEGKLLIGFEAGTIVQWDLRAKKADFRIYYDEAIHSVSWHHEGKQFMCSHSDGSLTLWNPRNTTKPFQVTFPHGKIQKDGRKESCKPILKVEYKTSRSSEPFIIFSGGLSYDKAGRRPALTIMHGKAITVLEMGYPIVEFMVLCETPYNNEVQEPYTVVVLLEKDLIVVDLTQSSFPVFENPYPMDIHESPVTCTAYFADCPPDIIPILYSIGAKHKKTGYSHKEWPVGGGTWTLGSHTYPEIIITGHADGSIKFWDASAFTLQMLYKLKTSKVFEKPKAGEGRSAEMVEEDPFAVQMVSWCPQSRIFCVVGISAHIILYRFSKYDANTQIVSLEVRLQCESEDVITPSENENYPCFSEQGSHSPQPHHQHPVSPGSRTPEGAKDRGPCLKVKERVVRVPPGYQSDLVIQLLWVDGEPPQQITSLDINSAYGLLAFGNCNGLAVVDYLQKTVILCMSTVDLYGATDPYQRLTRSPRRNRQSTSEHCMRGLSNFYSDSKKRIRTSYQSLTELNDNQQSVDMERSKSPTSGAETLDFRNDRNPLPGQQRAYRHHCSPISATHSVPRGLHISAGQSLQQTQSFWEKSCKVTNPGDHVNGHCTSPTSQPCSAGKPRIPMGPEGPRLTRRGPGRPPFRKAQSAACMEISLPVSHTEVGHASRRAMLQQLHGVTMYSHDEHHTTSYCWNERESRENSFSRSRSSSVSSIDRDTKEAITTLQFGESYGRKSDVLPTPCLWVGTSLGMVLLIPLSIPTDHEERMEEAVTVGPSGAVQMLKGSILRFAFLDCMGALIQSPYEVWRDLNAPEDPDRPRRRKLVHFSPSSSQDANGDGHLAVVCSERQAKVFLMPSQACLFVHNITESSFVLRADVVSVCNSVCLACFCANGHVMTLSLPSLRPLMDVNYLPLTDMRIARTFCFTNGGQALYLSSPTEIQRITYSQEMCDNLQEMLGELFTPIETPEAQNRGFLKGFFGGNAHAFDREELFGEAAAGKASRSLAQHIPGQGGVEGMKMAAGGAVGELARARIALDERGQRLGELEERTALMMTSAESFSKHAHELMLKCKDKKWYQF
ncbi:transcript variant X2 [Nothobranchius furzeri]|uniref:Syntaxin-binding protein 5-like n=1 Tax=Nothobranchius furzeri TaxID=105023 RepID=A0A9D2Y9R3_NOTFU|nr:transcript variant X2 [Nothobranchius furzeri]